MITLNGIPVNVTLFPDQTSQVWKLPKEILQQAKHAHISWEYTNENDFIHLAQLKDLLDQHALSTLLEIKYLPYGRQDKEVSNDATFALRTFAKLLNALRFDEIIITDPHSQVAEQIINNATAKYPIKQVLQVLDLTGAQLMCYPDKGAVHKYIHIYDFPYVYGEKVRDQATGNITNYQLVGDPKGKKVLIVDDICDGGMTFKLLAKDLLAAGATEVNLFVTHGIFSRGVRTLKESGINQVFTQDGEASEHQQHITYRRL